MFGVDYFKDRAKWETIADEIVFTARIDEYFNYACGELEYNLARLDNFGNVVYDASKTTLSKVDYIEEIELFYPKNDAQNATLYEHDMSFRSLSCFLGIK